MIQKVIFILILLFVTPLLAQETTILITVFQNGDQQELQFGFDPNGSDGFDQNLDLLAPPPPPGFFAHLLWKTQSYFKDIRNDMTPPDTFRVRYFRSGNEPVILRWNPASLPSDREFRITDDFGINSFVLDMTTVDSLVVDDHGLLFDQLRIIVEAGPVGLGEPVAGETPRDFQLAQNYPNPFNPSTKIRYYLRSVSTVELSIYDIYGRRIKTLIHKQQSAGGHEALWDGKNTAGRQVASGVYLYQLRLGDQTQIQKMVLLR